MFQKKIKKVHHKSSNHFKKIDDINFSPLFVLGSNRSGTSLISSILAQHPQLEGIFGKSKAPSFKEDSHVLAYCTSHHVWESMNPVGDWAIKDEGVLWGHPKHISKYYRDKPKDKNESLYLANSLKALMKTEKYPLVNSHFNMFRIGLITRIFPYQQRIMPQQVQT